MPTYKDVAIEKQGRKWIVAGHVFWNGEYQEFPSLEAAKAVLVSLHHAWSTGAVTNSADDVRGMVNVWGWNPQLCQYWERDGDGCINRKETKHTFSDLVSQLREAQRLMVEKQTLVNQLEKELHDQLHEARNELLTEEVVNVLVPEHGRTSCNDDNLANSNGRCARCALMYAARNKEWNLIASLHVEVEVVK